MVAFKVLFDFLILTLVFVEANVGGQVLLSLLCDIILFLEFVSDIDAGWFEIGKQLGPSRSEGVHLSHIRYLQFVSGLLGVEQFLVGKSEIGLSHFFLLVLPVLGFFSDFFFGDWVFY